MTEQNKSLIFPCDFVITWHNPETGNRHKNILSLIDCDNNENTHCNNCNGCNKCTYCTYCNDCYNCNDCNDCDTQPIQIIGLPYKVYLNKNNLTIGCQTHTTENWKAFTEIQLNGLHNSSKNRLMRRKYINLIKALADLAEE